MAAANLGELIDAIDLADAKTLREIEARLQYVKNARVSVDPVEDRAWNALRQAAREHDGRTLQRMLETTGKKTFTLAALRQLSDYADAYSGKKLTVNERHQVMCLLVTCLVDHVLGWNTSPKVDPVSLIRYMKYVPTAVDAAFPGYATARLLDRVALMRRAA